VVIAEEHVIDIELPTAIQFDSCQSVEFFANQTSSGALIQGATLNAPITQVSELSTNVEDAAVLAF
jgi:hypothetical protein